MGWFLRILAALVGIFAFGLGAWPVSLIVLIYLVYSLRRPRAAPLRQEVLPRPHRARGRLVLGGVLLLLSVIALGAGGTLSPLVFLVAGMAVVFWPILRIGGLTSLVVPVKDSVLLRSKAFPFRWYTVAEVKLESRDQTRGITAMDGRLLVFAGRAPSAFLIVAVCALRYGQAEERVIRDLQSCSRMLSQRGAHLLPLDSADAVRRLSLTLDRLNMGTVDLEGVASLPFDVFALRAREGVVVSHRAFRVSAQGGPASIPASDLSVPRPPLLAEVVEKIGEKNGWPGPDEYSTFLAAMDASRAEPLADKIRTKGEEGGKVTVETPGGAEVRLTRAQLRAVARIYR